ncbi:hypothetical protein KR018_009090, partial [Drosophila ironensis]
ILRVPHLKGVSMCILLAGGETRHTASLSFLETLLPNLQELRIFCPIEDRFPMIPTLRCLYVGKIAQRALDEAFQNSTLLEHFALVDGSHSSCMDIGNIGRCQQLKTILLPLLLRSPQNISHLMNLTHLRLVRQKLWKDKDWLPTVVDIIGIKRFQLNCITFDGSWMVLPFDLSLLQLTRCTALIKVRLSNCKLKDPTGLLFPFSCASLSFKSCIVGNLHNYLKDHPMLSRLNLYNSQVNRSGPLLDRVLALRKSQPVLNPLMLSFCQCTRLRAELANWGPEKLARSKAYIRVEEIEAAQVQSWKNQAGMIILKFSQPVSFMPNLSLPDD